VSALDTGEYVWDVDSYGWETSTPVVAGDGVYYTEVPTLTAVVRSADSRSTTRASRDVSLPSPVPADHPGGTRRFVGNARETAIPPM
jgi:hypothetical protein